MGVIYGIFLAIAVFFIIAISRSLTTFVHELGHAIPSLLFTNGPVKLIVGSYGDVDSHKLHIGRLQIWFKYNPLGWYTGLCQHERISILGKNLMVILGGPFASLMLSLGLLLLVVKGSFTDGQIFLISIFILSGFWDFCVNMYPSNSGIPLANGGQAFCDGRMILNLLQTAGHGEFLEKLKELDVQKDKNALFSHYNDYLNKKPSRTIATMMVEEFMDQKRYEDALDAFSIHLRPLKRKPRDFLLLAEVYQKVKNNHEALRCIEQYLYTEIRDLHGINMRGEIHLDLDNVEEAYKDFFSVLSIEPNSAIARINYGYVLTKKEEYAAAAPLIDNTIGLLEDYPRQQFYAGFFYMKTGQNEAALKCFNRAKELEWDHHGLNYYINEVDGGALG